MPGILLLYDSIIAGSMAGIMVWMVDMIKKGHSTLLPLYISVMMLVMNLLGISLLTGFYPLIFAIIASAYMAFGLFPVITKKDVKRNTGIVLFAVSMVFSEISMGGLIVTLSGTDNLSLLSAMDNPWFQYAMLAEMAFSLFRMNSWEKKKYYFNTGRNYRIALFGIMAFSISTFPGNTFYINFSIWESSVVMIISTVLIYETLYRQRLRMNQETSLSMQLIAIFTGMMAGEMIYLLYGTFLAFDIVTIISMVWYVATSLNHYKGEDYRNTNYMSNSRWTFSFILLTFVMEWFMGAVLSISAGYFRPGISPFISSLTLPWMGSGIFSPLWNAFDLFVSVTGSPWFLIMMGTEMGMLAFSKLLSARNRENRVRLALMISAFFIYSIYIPSFSPISGSIARIPYMWSMGIGTLGPVTSGVLFTGIIGTYVVSAVLSMMFGSRQICSVTCTAPMMYQGTFYDSLKKYNRTSNIGKKTLTSRIKPWFRAVVIITSIFVFSSAVISYLNSIHVISFTVFGKDIASLVYITWFDLLWYIVFVSIPFMGVYACVTEGWCYWGTFNQAMSYLGLFKLKVKDPSTCVTCKTVDCASACPVGLTDMRGPFISKGYFKAFKCIGVGDCIEACPYDNIYTYDIRTAIGSKINKMKKKKID